MNSFGFIGTGNMGGALASVIADSLGKDVTVSDIDEKKSLCLAEKHGCMSDTVENTVSQCKYVFLGVKPQVLPGLLKNINSFLHNRKDRFILVSMAAGIPIESIENMTDCNYPIIRIMPNTSVAIGKGVVLCCCNKNVTADEFTYFKEVMSVTGYIDEIPEKLIDAAGTITGCGPAFAYMFINGLAEGGVYCGLTKDKALQYAALTIEGAARNMVLTGKHPSVLKDAVCSPAGTTIEGVRVFEDGCLNGTCMKAIEAAYNKSKALK